MTRISGINFNIVPGTQGFNLYTKRTFSDNSQAYSDSYITSKLYMLYEQTKRNNRTYGSIRNLRKLVEGNNLDETI